MLKTYRLIKPYYFLAAGTILKRDIRGYYFVSQTDDQWVECHIYGNVKVSGRVVESDSATFREMGPNAEGAGNV